MTTDNDARRAHDVLDGLSAGRILSRENEKLLRSFLPELPKQKTLEEIGFRVYDAWIEASGNKWGGNSYDPDVSIEDWLGELHAQIKGLMDAPANTPALPAGMRIAEHEDYGRCVVSPSDDESNDAFRIFYRDEGYVTDSFSRYVESSSLTFIDAEPTHPEFLETAADYAEAPRGTVAAKDGWNAWLKETDGVWSCGGGSEGESSLAQTGKRRVLRWGWANEQPK